MVGIPGVRSNLIKQANTAIKVNLQRGGDFNLEVFPVANHLIAKMLSVDN